MTIAPLGDADPSDVVSFIVSRQASPETHITYVGDDAASMIAELSEADEWSERLLILRDAGRAVTGALLADIDVDMRRVWWIGPWAGDAVAAASLHTSASDAFGHLFDEEELAPDDRNEMVADFARTAGFSPNTASALLVQRQRPPASEPVSHEPDDSEKEAIALLHDQLFVGTHTPGSKLVQKPDSHVRCLSDDEGLIGYVAVEIEPDNSGYVDFLGVDPGRRSQGHGRSLVADAVEWLWRNEVSHVHLSVREDNLAARALYRSLGFVEERIARPWRRGFDLG